MTIPDTVAEMSRSQTAAVLVHNAQEGIPDSAVSLHPRAGETRALQLRKPQTTRRAMGARLGGPPLPRRRPRVVIRLPGERHGVARGLVRPDVTHAQG